MRTPSIVRHVLTALMLSAALVNPCLAGGLPEDLNKYINSGMAIWKIPGPFDRGREGRQSGSRQRLRLPRDRGQRPRG